MNEHLILILAAGVGSAGFAVLFNTSKIQILCAAASGLLVSGLYVLLSSYYSSILLNNMLCAMFVTLYAELFARFLKAPTSVFLFPAIISLVPGGFLYYSMVGLVTGDSAEAWRNANATLLTALGIAMGILIVSVLVSGMELLRSGKDDRRQAGKE